MRREGDTKPLANHDPRQTAEELIDIDTNEILLALENFEEKFLFW